MFVCVLCVCEWCGGVCHSTCILIVCVGGVKQLSVEGVIGGRGMDWEGGRHEVGDIVLCVNH